MSPQRPRGDGLGFDDRGDYFRIVIPPALTRLGAVRELMHRVGSNAGLSPSRVFDLQVVVSEASANAIEHAVSQVRVEAWVLYDRVVVEVSNDGVFQPGLYKDDPSRRRGLGLPLMASLADQVHISRLSNETRVSLTFFREPVATALAEVPHSPLSADFAIRKLETEVTKLRKMTARVHELADTQSGLREEKRRRTEELETLMEVSPVAIWVARDPECHTVLRNRAAEQLCEAEPGESLLVRPSPEGGDGHRRAGRRFFRDGKELELHELPMRMSAAHGVEIRDQRIDILCPSGRWKTVVGNSRPLWDGEGRVRGSVTAFVDTTPLDHLGEVTGRPARDTAESSQYSLSAAAFDLLAAASPAEVMGYAASQVSHLAGQALVAINEYRPDRGAVVLRALVGPPGKVGKVARALGREPRGLVLQVIDEPAARLSAAGLEKVEGGVVALLSRDFSEERVAAFQRDAELGDAYLMPLVSGDRFLGSVAILTDKAEGLRNRGTIEALIGHVASVLKRSLAQESLAGSEERYYSVFMESAVGIARIGVDGRYLEVNRRLADLLGREPEEVAGMALGDVTHPEDLRANIDLLERLLRGESSGALEKRYVRKDGSIAWVRVSGSAVRDSAGRVAYLVFAVEDITEQRQAQARLDQDKALLAGIAQILAEALSDRKEDRLGAVCLAVALDVTKSAAGFVAEQEDAGLRELAMSVQPSSVGGGSGGRGGDGGASPRRIIKVQGVLEHVVGEGKTLMINNPGSTLGVSLPPGHPELTSFLGVPLMRDGMVTGMIGVGNRVEGYGEAQRETLETLAPVVVEAYVRKRAEQRLRVNARRQRLLAKANARLYREQLSIAESLQSMLTHLPEEIGRVRLGHLYHSATEAAFVGGDFYDAVSLGNDRMAVLIGDVAGHGIKAARIALLAKDSVHAFLHQSLEPAEVLSETNALFLEKSLPGFVSLLLGILDIPSGVLRYAMAGHPYALVKKESGDVRAFMGGSLPLAIEANATWETSELKLDVADVLFLYTDGLIELRRNGEFLGEKGLMEMVRHEDAPVDRLPHAVLEDVLRFSGGQLRDDVAILALSLCESELQGGEEVPARLVRRLSLRLPTRRKPC